MAVVGGAMKVEHHEIATYRGLVDKAMVMGEAQLAQALTTNAVTSTMPASFQPCTVQGSGYVR